MADTVVLTTDNELHADLSNFFTADFLLLFDVLGNVSSKKKKKKKD